jgi:membrane protein
MHPTPIKTSGPARLLASPRLVVHVVFDAWHRFVAIQGIERSMALASQAFVALIPLAIVSAAFVPTAGDDDFADSIIERWHLTGASADSVRSLFAAPDAVEQGATWGSVLLLIVSAASFTRTLRRIYETTWEAPPRRMRGTPLDLIWIGSLIAFITALSSVRALIAGAFGAIALLMTSFLAGLAFWTLTPWLLLGRATDRRRLFPTGLVTAVASTALSVGSLLYMPRAIEQSAKQYGPIGVAFAILSWLVGSAFVVVGGAVLGRAIDARRHGERGRPVA